MNDPFALLGVDEDADDETVRKAYLRLVRAFPPEHEPVRFQEIREAYESIALAPARMGYRLFMAPKPDPLPLVAAWLREVEQRPSPEAQGMMAWLAESLRHRPLPFGVAAGRPARTGEK